VSLMWTIAGGLFLFFLLIAVGALIVAVPFGLIYGLRSLAHDWTAAGIVARRSRAAVNAPVRKTWPKERHYV
jgi:hypothetical protein